MNIILIIADSVRADYCGCYGNTWVRTPNVDALARESALLERFHTGSFPTGPMRKDVFSGRYTFTYSSWAMERPAAEVTLVDVLNRAGYRTAYIGDTDNSPQYRQGFGYEEVVPAWAADLASAPESVSLPADLRKLRGPLPRLERIVRNAQSWAGEEEHRAAHTMRSARRWLETQSSLQAPFFLWVDTFDPHEPWDCPRSYIDAYDPGYEGDELMEPAYEPSGYASQAEIEHMRCMYAGKLTMMDRWLGHLLEGIEGLGLLDDTAILFTSDHGFYHGEHGFIGKVQLTRDGTICRRWPLYATITHAPLLIRVPGLAGGSRFDAFCQPPDLMPTVLDLAGCSIPGRTHGCSLLPLLRGDIATIRDCVVSSLTYVQDAEVRSPTSVRTADFLYVYGGDEWAHELYDLHRDPGETMNVIDQHPDVAQDLHDDLLAFLAQVECPAENLERRREFRPTPRAGLPHRKTI